MAWEPEVLVTNIFKEWDTDGTGFISKENLQAVLERLGFNKAESSAIFGQADCNNDGKIDYGEFVSWIFQRAPPRAKKQLLHDIDLEASLPKPCIHGCGWTARAPHLTCCRKCAGSHGPHNRDCHVKNKLLPPLCKKGCGRPAFSKFDVCCTKCTGATGTHCRDCTEKAVARLMDRTEATVVMPDAGSRDGSAIVGDDLPVEAHLCIWGCGRPTTATSAACCAKCTGVDGVHCADCGKHCASRAKQEHGATLPELDAATVPAVSDVISISPLAGNVGDCTLCKWGCGRRSSGTSGRCCTKCTGKEAAEWHSKDCAVNMSPEQSEVERQEVKMTTEQNVHLCEWGCGHAAFGGFTSCCTKCNGKDGPHARDCAEKSAARFLGRSATLPRASTIRTSMTPEDVAESIRMQLAEWDEAGAACGRGNLREGRHKDSTHNDDGVNDFITALANASGMRVQDVRMLWHTTVTETRRIGRRDANYVSLAEAHHGVNVIVVDLGQYSAVHHNSCMFLTCAIALIYRMELGHGEVDLDDSLGKFLKDASGTSIETHISEHKRNRCSAIGKIADALRTVACEALEHDKAFYLPFFHPVGPRRMYREMTSNEAYDAWLEQLRNDAEGDELVILALSRLCNLAIQPVQISGYRVPLMDPMDAAKNAYITYWGNDDQHWVWLKAMAE